MRVRSKRNDDNGRRKNDYLHRGYKRDGSKDKNGGYNKFRNDNDRRRFSDNRNGRNGKRFENSSDNRNGNSNDNKQYGNKRNGGLPHRMYCKYCKSNEHWSSSCPKMERIAAMVLASEAENGMKLND